MLHEVTSSNIIEAAVASLELFNRWSFKHTESTKCMLILIHIWHVKETCFLNLKELVQFFWEQIDFYPFGSNKSEFQLSLLNRNISNLSLSDWLSSWQAWYILKQKFVGCMMSFSLTISRNLQLWADDTFMIGLFHLKADLCHDIVELRYINGWIETLGFLGVYSAGLGSGEESENVRKTGMIHVT